MRPISDRLHKRSLSLNYFAKGLLMAFFSSWTFIGIMVALLVLLVVVLVVLRAKGQDDD